MSDLRLEQSTSQIVVGSEQMTIVPGSVPIVKYMSQGFINSLPGIINLLRAPGCKAVQISDAHNFGGNESKHYQEDCQRQLDARALPGERFHINVHHDGGPQDVVLIVGRTETDVDDWRVAEHLESVHEQPGGASGTTQGAGCLTISD